MTTSKPTCPLAAVDQRLQDAHDLWHRADKSYFDPNTFRMDCQNLIQTLRTVTFILQANKAVIPDFDDWYGQQQNEMRADPVLRWLVEARNTIEKRGDLESTSVVRASILASHLDEFPVMEVGADLFEGPAEIFAKVPRIVLQEQVLKHGVLRIERRWVQRDLADYEILDALAECFGKLGRIVESAHHQIGWRSSSDDDNSLHTLSGRLPCMVNHLDRRALLIHLANGSRLNLTVKSKPFDRDKARKAAKRYGELPSSASNNPNDFDAVTRHFFEMGRTIIERDSYHDSMAFLFHGEGGFVPVATPMRDRQDKYLVSRRLAELADTHSAHTVIVIGEAWMASPGDLKGFQYPADVPTRREVLSLSAVKNTGQIRTIQALITRKGKKVRLGPTEIIDGGTPYMFAPVLEKWGIPLPIPEDEDAPTGNVDER